MDLPMFFFKKALFLKNDPQAELLPHMFGKG